jgi:hypothetical protein
MAERVMTAVQAAYRERGEGEMIGIYSVLPHAHDVARDVLWRAGGESNLLPKETQLRVSRGVPLAVCTGKLTVERVLRYGADGLIGEAPHLGRRYGCGRIFRDTIRTSGRPWATTCPECRAKRTERRRAEQRRMSRQPTGQ